MNPLTHARFARGPRAAVAVLGVALVVAGACSSGDNAARDDVGATRAAALQVAVDQVVVPGVEQAGRDADDLRRAVDRLCDSPEASELETAREATATAWRSWERLAAVDFGPVSDRRSMSFVNYPVDEAGVDEQLAAGPPADSDAARNRLASGRRGYGAVRHLLVGDPAAPLNASALDDARCTYLASLVELILEETAGVEQGWNAGPSDGLPYRSTLMGIGDGALSTQEALDMVINGQLNRLEAASKALTKAAEAPGDPGQPPPGRVFSIAAMLGGVADVQEELAPLLPSSTAAVVAKESDEAIDALEPFAASPDVGAPSTDELADAAAAIEALRQTISTEVVSALDVTVGFSDNDGDS